MMRVAGVLLFAAATATMYAPNNPNIYYSPFAWHVTNESAATINSASYIRFLAGSSGAGMSFLNFKFDVSHMVTPASEVYWRVDNGPMTLSLVLDTVAVAIPENNTAGIAYHMVELFVKSTTERGNRWSATGDSTRIILSGVETDGELAPWLPSDVNLLIYGDSITEGVLTLGGSQSFDTDHNDASVVYSHALGPLLGAEAGVIGFGYNAMSHDGSGGVAPLGQAWNQLWDGVPRSFTNPKPDLIVLNEGTNDGCDTTEPGCEGTDITAAMTEVLQKLLAASPGVPIAVLEPFNGGQVAHLKAAVAAAGSADVHYVDTSGFYDMKFGGNLHPTGPNDITQIAPRIAQRLRPLLARSILARSVVV